MEKAAVAFLLVLPDTLNFLLESFDFLTSTGTAEVVFLEYISAADFLIEMLSYITGYVNWDNFEDSIWSNRGDYLYDSLGKFSSIGVD